MAHPNRMIIRLILLGLVSLLVSGLVNACRPVAKNTSPNINEVVATGMAGTQYAWALSTIVSATQSAMDGPAHAQPSPASTSSPVAAVDTSRDACAGNTAGKRSYVDAQEGFCLFYPEDFFVNKPASAVVEFLGPALDSSSQPLRAYINISKKEPVSSRTLDEIAMSVWKEPRSAYHLSNIKLGGQDALVAADLQIGEASWKVKQVLYTRGGFVYLISFSPVDTTPPFDKALPDIQRFWDLAIPSFTFR